MRSASARISGRSLDTTSTASPAARLRANHLVNLELRADVHALGRLVEQQHARPGRHPLGDDDLLLIAAAQRIGQGIDAGRLDPPVAQQSRPRRGVHRRPHRSTSSPSVAFGITRLWRRSRLKSSPCRWRSSGTSTMPARAASRGESKRDRRAVELNRRRRRADEGRRSFRAVPIVPSRPGRRVPTISPRCDVQVDVAKVRCDVMSRLQTVNASAFAAVGLRSRPLGPVRSPSRASLVRPWLSRCRWCSPRAVVNVSTNAPSRSTVMRSHSRNTSGRRCETYRIVVPPRLQLAQDIEQVIGFRVGQRRRRLVEHEDRGNRTPARAPPAAAGDARRTAIRPARPDRSATTVDRAPLACARASPASSRRPKRRDLAAAEDVRRRR